MSKSPRCALCDTTQSLAGWYNWNNRPTVKFCHECWNRANKPRFLAGLLNPGRWYHAWRH